jgi:hypothetical protein
MTTQAEHLRAGIVRGSYTIGDHELARDDAIEISLDSGRTWQPAHVEFSRPLGNYVAVLDAGIVELKEGLPARWIPPASMG